MNKQSKKQNTATDSNKPKDDNTYNGAELKPYIGRPGAMDAYQLPSMVSGVRVPHKTPILNTESKK